MNQTSTRISINPGDDAPEEANRFTKFETFMYTPGEADEDVLGRTVKGKTCFQQFAA